MARNKRKRFEQLMLPHFDAAYNLARYLVCDTQEAEDIVQTSYIKAFEAFDRYIQGNSAAWLLTIVRNTAYTWLEKRKRFSNLISFDEASHGQQDIDPEVLPIAELSNPEILTIQAADRTKLQKAINRLPIDFREVLILREIEGFSYNEIAFITHSPKGTVMSRLSRARKQLQSYLLKQHTRGNKGAM